MNEMDELCRMLDERGVEHEGGERSLRWRDRHGIMMQAFPLADGELGMEVWSCTPEQAIAATLGAGTCEVEESWHGESEMVEYHCTACDEYMAVEVVKPNGAQPPNFCPNCGAKVVDE